MVYQAIDLVVSEEVVVKIQYHKIALHLSDLKHKFMVLHQMTDIHSITCVIWLGEEDGCPAIVLCQLGPSLEELFLTHKHNFSLYTITKIGTQLVPFMLFLPSHYAFKFNLIS